MIPDLRIDIGNVEFKNPIITASGTFGYGQEFERIIDLDALGGIVTKSITLEERLGHPPPRTFETAAGMLNAIGLANVGVDRFIDEKLPFLRKLKTVIIVNVAGSSIEEYVEVCRRLEKAGGFDMFEINVSCPNVDEGGMVFGTDGKMIARVINAVKEVTPRPLIAKLTPNVTSIGDMALAAQNSGAAAVSLINTMVGMAVDINTWKPCLSNTTGGLSGPAIKPIGVAMVHKVFQAIDIPIIGMGGISTWRDAIEYHLVGARGIQIGTANFIEPDATIKIIKGISKYLSFRKINSLTEIIGKIED